MVSLSTRWVRHAGNMFEFPVIPSAQDHSDFLDYIKNKNLENISGKEENYVTADIGKLPTHYAHMIFSSIKRIEWKHLGCQGHTYQRLSI